MISKKRKIPGAGAIAKIRNRFSVKGIRGGSRAKVRKGKEEVGSR